MIGGIDVIRTGAIVTLRLNNEAKRNSLDLPMLLALRQAALQIANDDTVRAVVLRGAGSKAFCAGADFDAITVPPVAQSVAAMEDALHQVIDALAQIPVPLIAAIEGACFGGGVQLALCADFRIANDKAKFGIPAAQIGMAYPLAAITQIVRYAGASAASKLILTGEPFAAQEALRHRLIDEVVAPRANVAGDVSVNIARDVPGDAASQTLSPFDERLTTLTHTITGYDRASAIAYKAIIRALDTGNAAGAQHAHRTFADAALYLPKLEAILAERAQGKSSVPSKPNNPNKPSEPAQPSAPMNGAQASGQP